MTGRDDDEQTDLRSDRHRAAVVYRPSRRTDENRPQMNPVGVDRREKEEWRRKLAPQQDMPYVRCDWIGFRSAVHGRKFVLSPGSRSRRQKNSEILALRLLCLPNPARIACCPTTHCCDYQCFSFFEIQCAGFTLS